MIQRGLTIVEGPKQYAQKEDSSGTTTRTFEGNEQDIIDKAHELLGLGYATTVDEGPPWKLTAVLSYNTLNGDTQEPEPEPQWTIQSHYGEQNIFETDIDLVKGLSAEARRNIIHNLKNLRKDPLSSDSSELGQAHRLYAIMSSGADSKRYNTIAVSRTIRVSRRYVSKWDLVDVNKVLSKSSLVNKTNMPQWVQVLLPESKPSSRTVRDGALTDEYNTFFGYFEEYPQYQTSTNNKVEISQTWIFNEWLEDYYGTQH